MSKFLCLVKSVMAIVGCAFCILVAVTKLPGPFFRKRTMQINIAELCKMKEMCSRIEHARQETKNKGEQAWEQFIQTNSYIVTNQRLPNGEFYVAAMIMNPNANVWDRGSMDDARVRAYFVVFEGDDIKVWKESVGEAYPIRQIPNREWRVDVRRKLFEVFNEVCSGDLP